MVDLRLNTGAAIPLQHAVTLDRDIQEVEAILHSSDVIICAQEEQHVVIQFVLHFGEGAHVVIFHSFLDHPGIQRASRQQGFGGLFPSAWTFSTHFVSIG